MKRLLDWMRLEHAPPSLECVYGRLPEFDWRSGCRRNGSTQTELLQQLVMTTRVALGNFRVIQESLHQLLHLPLLRYLVNLLESDERKVDPLVLRSGLRE